MATVNQGRLIELAEVLAVQIGDGLLGKVGIIRVQRFPQSGFSRARSRNAIEQTTDVTHSACVDYGLNYRE